jgi:hypothetical protein
MDAGQVHAQGTYAHSGLVIPGQTGHENVPEALDLLCKRQQMVTCLGASIETAAAASFHSLDDCFCTANISFSILTRCPENTMHSCSMASFRAFEVG